MTRPSRRAIVNSMIAAAVSTAAVMLPRRPAQAAPMAGDDAMWVWGDRIAQPEPALAGFAEAAGVGRLFVYVGPAEAEALASGRRDAIEALALLRARGASIFAAAGEPEWASPGILRFPEHAAMLARLPSSVPGIDGVHLDVEPHALAEWNQAEGRARLSAGLLRFLDGLRAAAPGATIDAAINPVYATTFTGGESLAAAVARRVDAVSVMAYRSSPARAVAWAAPAAEAICSVKRKWRLGVLSGDGEPGTSWAGRSAQDFRKGMDALRALEAAEGGGRCCIGLAYQDYDSLARLLSLEGNDR